MSRHHICSSISTASRWLAVSIYLVVFAWSAYLLVSGRLYPPDADQIVLLGIVLTGGALACSALLLPRLRTPMIEGTAAFLNLLFVAFLLVIIASNPVDLDAAEDGLALVVSFTGPTIAVVALIAQSWERNSYRA